MLTYLLGKFSKKFRRYYYYKNKNGIPSYQWGLSKFIEDDFGSEVKANGECEYLTEDYFKDLNK
jgi:hypothetical protein